MKRIAIAACENSNSVCAACACLKAFNERIRAFERYAGEDICLTAFMRCSHCDKEGDPMTDAGFVEKLDRFVSEGVDIVHIGPCGGRTEETACPAMAKMAQAFRSRGMTVVWGTH